MTRRYLNIADFELFQKNELASLLTILNQPIKNPNLLNEAGAKMLEWDDYLKLHDWQLREKAIVESIYVEKFNKDGNRIKDNTAIFTIQNIRIEIKGKLIYIKTLIEGEENLILTEMNCDYLFDFLPHFTSSDFDVILLDPATNKDNVSTLLFQPDSRYFSLSRTKDGIAVTLHGTESEKQFTLEIPFNCKDSYDGECYCVQTYLPFLHIKENALIGVDCNYARESIDTVSYQFLQPVNADGERRWLKVGEGEEICLSEIMFASKEDAWLAIEEERFGYDENDVSNAILVRVEKTPV